MERDVDGNGEKRCLKWRRGTGGGRGLGLLFRSLPLDRTSPSDETLVPDEPTRLLPPRLPVRDTDPTSER